MCVCALAHICIICGVAIIALLLNFDMGQYTGDVLSAVMGSLERFTTMPCAEFDSVNGSVED